MCPYFNLLGHFPYSRRPTRRAVQSVIQAQRDVLSISVVIPATSDAHSISKYSQSLSLLWCWEGSEVTSISKKGPIDYGPGITKGFSVNEQ